MANFDLPELPETRVTPQLMMGAASPLWAYFGAAAAGGVAYWWMTRWTQPMNLEALLGAAMVRPAAALEPLVAAAAEPVVEAAEAVAETADAALEATAGVAAEALPDAPMGGEAAPVSPLIEAVLASEPEAPPERVIEAAKEPAGEAAPGAVVETAPEPSVETPPVMEATADPLPEPVAKPRSRKTSPANGLEA